MMSTDRILVLGFGNPGRLDDGLGWGVVEAVRAMALPGVDAEHDYQLNIEHAGVIAGYGTVVFADAAVGGEGVFLRLLLPRRAESFSSHVMRPEAVLSFAEEVFGWRGLAYLLGVRGYEFNEYEERLSGGARENLARATALLARGLAGGDLEGVTTGDPVADSARACNGGAPCKTANT